MPQDAVSLRATVGHCATVWAFSPYSKLKGHVSASPPGELRGGDRSLIICSPRHILPLIRPCNLLVLFSSPCVPQCCAPLTPQRQSLCTLVRRCCRGEFACLELGVVDVCCTVFCLLLRLRYKDPPSSSSQFNNIP